jgi:hypothetical protein
MGQWTQYYKIVKPAPAKNGYVAQDSYNADQATISNFSWYTQVMKGAGSRMQRYSQYDAMDTDVDIARAIDTIAEEMSPKNEKTELPFNIHYQNDDNKEVKESIVMTVKAALRHWADLQDLDNRVFRVSRYVIKYGDCFFRKFSDHKKWMFVEPKEVIGIELSEEGVAVSYHLRKNDNKKGAYSEVDIVPVKGIVHFTLSDDMGEAAPFGDSVLMCVTKAFKQLGMLEDSVIIYRVVRAPERRVFYIDTGNMPAHKVKQYLEGVKNEVRQKRIPNGQDGQDKIDSVYNPTSMAEDYFFATTANGRGSRIETLPGGEQLGEITDLDYFKEKVFRGLRVPTSYMNSAAKGGQQYNDGKVGVAYVEEMRFANYVKRLQNKIEKIFDAEFKIYLTNSNINVDPNLFKLKLPDPQNFALYRQAALDTDLVNTFNTVQEIPYISKRFALKRYLGYSEDDMQTNEAMLRQERKIPETADFEDITDIQMIYDPAFYENRDPIKYEAPSEDAPPEDDDGDDGSDADQELDDGEDTDTKSSEAPEAPDDTGKEVSSKSAVES